MPDHKRSPDCRQYDIGVDTMISVDTYVYTGPKGKGQSPGVQISLAVAPIYADLLIDPSWRRYNMRKLVDGREVFEVKNGVLTRDQVRDLRNQLSLFLLDFPEEEPDV